MRKLNVLLLTFALGLFVASCGEDDVVPGGSTPPSSEDTEWTSTNHADGSTSSTVFTLEYKAFQVLLFDWSVSSEESHDFLIVSLDGEEILRESGKKSGKYEHLFMTSGTSKLEVKYVKDDYNSENEDVAKVSNVRIVGDTKPSGTITGHDFVDLGLPSGTKWATCNVGASSPEQFGDYFAWGETTGFDSGKNFFAWSTYVYCKGTKNSYTKYCINSDHGILDNKTELDLDDDAARTNWGGTWRMPSKAQQDELRDTYNCFWTRTTLNGNVGYMITSKCNGNSIFLPSAGFRFESSLNYGGENGSYWSSSLDPIYSGHAYELFMNPGQMNWSVIERFYGLPVRAVCP